MGKIVRTLSADGSVLCSAISSTDIVKEFARLHNSTPVVTAAMGRMATAASIMGAMLKYEGDRLTLRINGGGPCGTMTAVSDYRGNVKCCVGNAGAEVPLTVGGGLDVPGVVGTDGTLTVIKDMGLKEPYVGQIPLAAGDIAQDISAYYTYSEQIPTVCALGILFDENAQVSAAGGFVVQVVPPVSEESVKIVEQNLAKSDRLSQLLEEGCDPEEIALSALEGLGAEVLDSWEAQYYCDCSRERTKEIIASLGEKEFRKLAEEQENTEVVCHFCNKRYNFSRDELLKMLKH